MQKSELYNMEKMMSHYDKSIENSIDSIYMWCTILERSINEKRNFMNLVSGHAQCNESEMAFASDLMDIISKKSYYRISMSKNNYTKRPAMISEAPTPKYSRSSANSLIEPDVETEFTEENLNKLANPSFKNSSDINDQEVEYEQILEFKESRKKEKPKYEFEYKNPEFDGLMGDSKKYEAVEIERSNKSLLEENKQELTEEQIKRLKEIDSAEEVVEITEEIVEEDVDELNNGVVWDKKNNELTIELKENTTPRTLAKNLNDMNLKNLEISESKKKKTAIDLLDINLFANGKKEEVDIEKDVRELTYDEKMRRSMPINKLASMTDIQRNALYKRIFEDSSRHVRKNVPNNTSEEELLKAIEREADRRLKLYAS